MRFYYGNDDYNFLILFGKNEDSECEFCGKSKELVPGMTDGAREKHIPVYEWQNDKLVVHIAEQEHPMGDEHYIEWICLKTNKGFQLKTLSPSDKPRAEFVFTDGEKPVSVYEYCNLHGLWKTDVK